MIRRAALLPWTRQPMVGSKLRFPLSHSSSMSRHLLSTVGHQKSPGVFLDNPTAWAKTRWESFVKKSKVIIWKALTEPSPRVAGIQQLGAISTVISYAASDVLVLRVLAISGILLFNMIPNYYKLNYLNIGWGFAFLGFNVYRFAEIVRDRTTTATSLGFTPTELAVYEAKFQRHLTPRKFHALLQCAEWREVEPGAVALDSTKECGLLVSGRCKVSKQGSTLLVAKSNMFLAVPNFDAVSHPPASSSSDDGGSARGDLLEAVGNECRSGVHQTSILLLPELAGILATSQAPPNREGAPHAEVNSVENRISDSDEKFSATAAVAAVAAAFSAEAAAATAAASPSSELPSSSDRDEETHALAVQAAASASSLSATVAATSDGPCKLLVWPVASLVSHFQEHEATGAAMLRVFNEALVENALARDHVLVVEKYRALLRRCLGTWSTSGTKGEETTLPAGHKMALSNFRKAQNICDEDHHACLTSLGWTLEEYEWGAKKDSARASAALLKLSRGFGATSGSKTAAVAAAPSPTSHSSSKRNSASTAKPSTVAPDLEAVSAEIPAHMSTSGQNDTTATVSTAAKAVESTPTANITSTSTNREEIAANRIKKVWEKRSKGTADFVEGKAYFKEELAGSQSAAEALAASSSAPPSPPLSSTPNTPNLSGNSAATSQSSLNRKSALKGDRSSVALFDTGGHQHTQLPPALPMQPPSPPLQLPPNSPQMPMRSVTLGSPLPPSHKAPSISQMKPLSRPSVDSVGSSLNLRSARSESEPISARIGDPAASTVVPTGTAASSATANVGPSSHREHRRSLTMKAEQLWRRADNAALAMRSNATLHSHFAESSGSLPPSSGAALSAAAAALQRHDNFQADSSYAETSQSSLRSSTIGHKNSDIDIASLRRNRRFTADISSWSNGNGHNYSGGGSLRATGTHDGSSYRSNRWRETNSQSLNLGKDRSSRHFDLHPSLFETAAKVKSASDFSGVDDSSTFMDDYSADDLAAVARYFAQDKRRRAADGSHEVQPNAHATTSSPLSPSSRDNNGRINDMPSWKVLEQRRARLSSDAIFPDEALGDANAVHFEPTPLPPIWAVKVENDFGDSMFSPSSGHSKVDAAHQTTIPAPQPYRETARSSHIGRSPSCSVPVPNKSDGGATTPTRLPQPSLLSSSINGQPLPLDLPLSLTSIRPSSLRDLFSPLGDQEAGSTVAAAPKKINSSVSSRSSIDRTSHVASEASGASPTSYYRSALDIFAQGPPSPMKAMMQSPLHLPPMTQLPQQYKLQRPAGPVISKAKMPSTKKVHAEIGTKLKRSKSF